MLSWGAELVSTGMPRRIAEMTATALEGADYFRTVVGAVKSDHLVVYLWGANGNGKTHMASWLFSHWHARNLQKFNADMESRARGWYPSARWATCNTITAALKNFSRDDFDFEREMRFYSRPDVLMIDDLWADRATQVDVQNVVEIIETRTTNGRRTVITGNHNPATIHADISRRFGDRLNDHLVVEFTGGSYRLQRKVMA